MGTFWAGVALGFVFNLVASHVWELWKQHQSYRLAEKLIGKWTAYNRDGRTIDQTPMKGARLTEILPKSWLSRWLPNSHVLNVRGQDEDDNGVVREHEGYLAIDLACPRRATRTVMYKDSDEIAEQRIEISADCKTLYVYPVAPTDRDYNAHALRKTDERST